ncbi:MAG TPA: hypothetical protein VFS02_13815 [Telluria sp.]|nr:hypothetical protein [Telluria sp.]
MRRLLSAVACALLMAMLAGLPASAAPPDVAPCDVAGATPSADDLRDARHLQQSIEANPLFLKPAAASRVLRCTATFESRGRFVLDYRFRGKQSLRVERDTAIEYLAIKSTFQLAPGELAESILTQAEQSQFGQNGCGLDMQKADTHPVQYEKQISETVYQGKVCNCRGIVRRDAKQQVIGFILTSTC